MQLGHALHPFELFRFHAYRVLRPRRTNVVKRLIGSRYSDSSEVIIPSVTISFTAPAIVTVLLVAADELDAADEDAADADDATAAEAEDEGGDVVITVELGADEDVVVEAGRPDDDDVDEVGLVVVTVATTAEDAVADDVAFEKDDEVSGELVLVTGTAVPFSLIASMYTGLHWLP